MEFSSLSFGTLTVGTIFMGFGIYYYVKPYLQSYVQTYVTSKVMAELNKKQDEEGNVFQHLERTNSAVILYKQGGKEHKVCVPYDRSKVTAMLRKQVYLTYDDNTIEKIDKIDITHKPGVPYLLSARDMGGDKIIVIKDNKTVKEYSIDEIPGYLN